MIILKGPPGSGKSTWAREYQKTNPSYLVVSRDAIRESLVPNHRATWYTRPDRKELEKLVNHMVNRNVLDIWDDGFNVILDETNPDVEKWTRAAVAYDKISIVVPMTTPIEECIRRDSLREYPVGEEVIRRIAGKLNYQPSWEKWIGKEIVKKSGKPFPSKKKTEWPISLVTNPFSKKPAFLLGEAIVDCDKCELF